MDKTQIHKTIRSRRAVSPIIATLLLIAIAVIGGVMIYVFTQGFFGNSSITTSPSVDTITLSGYDMREVIPAGGCVTPTAGLSTHEGTLICHGDAATDDGKADSEAGAIYIRNVGQKSYTISKIEVNGKALGFVTTDLALDGPAVYGIYSAESASDIAISDAPATTATVLPGQEATIVVSFDDTAGSDNTAAAGRTIPVKISSASGSVYNFNVVVGSKS